ncbi:hypothetical protein FJ364_02350 [Candidatus Dependentiae bacterium]|nr:hypothetical protein [Candidatus Dependentiae bacterium]
MLTLTNKSYNKLTLTITLLLLVLSILGLPFTKWGFKTDDWANIQHSQLTSWEDVKNIFTEGNMESINHPSNSAPDKGSFLQGLYRPMSFIYYWPQTLLFGTQAYGYFLVTILFHALNTALFFLILAHFFSISASFTAALFFGFHPSLHNWLGWISAQTYFIELFVLGLIFTLFYRWLLTKHWYYYAGALLLFFINLLLKEATIILPAWVFLAVLVYKYQQPLETLRLRSGQALQDNLFTAFLNASGFILISLAYFGIRLSCMPFSSNNTSTLGFVLTWQSFITKQCARTMQFVTYVYDILGISWLPKGHRLLNGAILIIIIGLLFLLFIRSNRKLLLLFCLTSTIMFSWPGLLMHYQPRYMYMGLPWMITFVVLAFETMWKWLTEERSLETLRPCSGRALVQRKDNKFRDSFLKSIVDSSDTARPEEALRPSRRVSSVPQGKLTLIAIFIPQFLFFISLSSFLYTKLKAREGILHRVDQSLRILINKDLAAINWQHTPLYFCGLPAHWFAMGTAQAMWFLTNNKNYPVYQSGPTISMPKRESYLHVPRSDTASILIQQRGANFTFSSSDMSELFLIKDDAIVSIDHSLRVKDLTIVTWDYKDARFKILTTLPALAS